MIWPFSQSAQPKVNAEAVNSMLALKRDRLAIVELLYRQSEQRFLDSGLALARYRNSHREGEPFWWAGKLFVPIKRKPDHQREILVHEEWVAKTRRDELLDERAELRKSLGLSR